MSVPEDRPDIGSVRVSTRIARHSVKALYFHTSRIMVGAAKGTCQPVCMDTGLASLRLEALANPTRLTIYRLLVRAGDGGLSVGQVQEKLEIPASTLSHHLRTLTGADLVIQDRQGTSLICRTNYPVMRGLVDFLASECCADTACRPISRPA